MGRHKVLIGRTTCPQNLLEERRRILDKFVAPLTALDARVDQNVADRSADPGKRGVLHWAGHGERSTLSVTADGGNANGIQLTLWPIV